MLNTMEWIESLVTVMSGFEPVKSIRNWPEIQPTHSFTTAG